MELQDDAELRQLVDEQTALRRVATLVASGAGETELLTTVTSEIGRLFGAHAANTMRWDGDSIRVLGAWSGSLGQATLRGGHGQVSPPGYRF